MRAHFIGYLKESLGYYFYLSEDHNVIVSRYAKFLERDFIQDEGSRRKIQLEKSISEEQRVIEPKEPIPPRRSSTITCPSERYMGMLEEDMEEIFFMDDMDHVDDPKTYDETMSDINFEKWLEVIKSEIDNAHQPGLDLSRSTRKNSSYWI